MDHPAPRCFARLSAALAAGLALVSCHSSPVAVEASALEVRAALSTSRIAASGRAGGDTASVMVSVTNPQGRPVVIHLGGPPYKSGQIPAAETEGIASACAWFRWTAGRHAARASGLGDSQASALGRGRR